MAQFDTYCFEAAFVQQASHRLGLQVIKTSYHAHTCPYHKSLQEDTRKIRPKLANPDANHKFGQTLGFILKLALQWGRAFRHITKTLPIVLTRQWKESNLLLRRVCTCGNETQKIDSWLKQINETRSHKAYSLLTVFVVCQLLLCGALGQEVLFKLWFQRRDGKPCVFEHVFLGISVAFGIGFIMFHSFYGWVGELWIKLWGSLRPKNNLTTTYILGILDTTHPILEVPQFQLLPVWIIPAPDLTSRQLDGRYLRTARGRWVSLVAQVLPRRGRGPPPKLDGSAEIQTLGSERTWDG